MGDWMTTEDLCEYLRISETKARHLIRHRAIPFHKKLGLPRFYRPEIDDWMRTPGESHDEAYEALSYRGRSIREYTLAASMVLIGRPPWDRLADFVRRTIIKVDEEGRLYLYRENFEGLLTNSMDYLRLCFSLGLIDKQQEGRKVRYYPTEYSRRIALAKDIDTVKEIIRESVLALVGNRMETRPDERHAILLLWYLLKLRSSGQQPLEEHFNRGGEVNEYPRIRLNFAKSFHEYLFGKDPTKEQEFFKRWERCLTE
jgi:excisionase family DNA binding protein